MNCKYSIRKKKINGKRAWLFAPSDQVTPYHWSRLKSFMEAAGGIYKKYLYSFVFNEDPHEAIQAYVERYCGSDTAEEPFRFAVKTKTSHVGATGYQEMVATRVKNSQNQNHKKKKRGQKKSKKAWEPTEKFLLQKASIENEAEIIRLKNEGEKLSNDVRGIRLANQEKKKIDQENQETERLNNLAKKESKRKEGIMDIAREILSIEIESDLDSIQKTWTGNKAIQMLISSRRSEIKKGDELNRISAKNKFVLDSLISKNGQIVNYDFLRKLGISPTGDNMEVNGIFLNRMYLYFEYQIVVSQQIKLPDFNLKVK